MQPETSSTVLHKCRCCLIEGEHPHNIHDYFYIKMFRETFNITPVTGWRLPQWICTGCVDSLKEAKRFRDMVTATEKQLIQALPNTHRVQLSADTSIVKAEGSDTDSVDLQDYDPSPSPEEMLSSQEPEIAIVVKAEDDEYTTMTIGPTVVERRVTRRTGRASVETKPEIPSGVSWPEVLEPDLKDNKTDTKQELDEVVSETPTRTLHSDATKILENIVQTLQHSTILPFRHSQKHIDRFKCFYCENTYELKELREHTESQHVGRVSDKTILSLVRTRSYRAIHAEISCTKCRLCNEEFKTVETLIEHLTKIHEKVYHETRKRSQGILTFDLSSGEMKCHLCNEDFPYFAALSSHMNEHYGDFVCRVCKKKFATKDRCHSHLMKVHIWKEKKQELICDYCNGSFKNRVRLIYHMKNHHLNAVIKCQFCPKTFLFKDDLKRALHMKNEHKAGSITGFQCAICGYITHKKCRFGEHMDTHNGVKKNKCEVCGKRYGTRATLKAHMRCHSDERKYACSVCGAAFRHPSSLKHHTGRKHHDSNT